jgi:hypothetical protein
MNAPGDEPGSRLRAALFLVAGLLICLAFFNSPGTGDRAFWLSWMNGARHAGIFAAYTSFAGQIDYPPLSVVLLGALSHVADILHISDFAALKLSLLLFTLACAITAFLFAQRRRAAVAIAMFLTLVLNAMLEVYIDAYSVLFLLLAVYCFERKHPAAGAAFFAVSCLIKWQPIILTPLVVLYVLPRRPKAVDLTALLPAALFSLIVFLPYAREMIQAFANGYADLLMSGTALNLNWLIGALMQLHHAPDAAVQIVSHVDGSYVYGSNPSHSLPATGLYLFLFSLSSALRYFCYFTSLYFFYASDRSLLNFIRACIVCFMSYFIFGNGVHENHACVPAVLAVLWFALDRSRYVEATLLAAIFNINLLVFYGFDGTGLRFSPIVGMDVTLYLAAFNVILFLFLWLPVANDVRQRLGRAGELLHARLTGNRK